MKFLPCIHGCVLQCQSTEGCIHMATVPYSNFSTSTLMQIISKHKNMGNDKRRPATGREEGIFRQETKKGSQWHAYRLLWHAVHFPTLLCTEIQITCRISSIWHILPPHSTFSTSALNWRHRKSPRNRHAQLFLKHAPLVQSALITGCCLVICKRQTEIKIIIHFMLSTPATVLVGMGVVRPVTLATVRRSH